MCTSEQRTAFCCMPPQSTMQATLVCLLSSTSSRLEPCACQHSQAMRTEMAHEANKQPLLSSALTHAQGRHSAAGLATFISGRHSCYSHRAHHQISESDSRSNRYPAVVLLWRAGHVQPTLMVEAASIPHSSSRPQEAPQGASSPTRATSPHPRYLLALTRGQRAGRGRRLQPIQRSPRSSRSSVRE